jgi:chemosensory pili system protein ChpA (sensor histidine kinase/response regulator)
MATSSSPPSSAKLDIGVNDLGPLAWVLDELRKSLDAATKALRRYTRDAELAKGSDLNAADATQLRIARQQLHQSVGALEMVGFAAPASLLRGMEGAVQKFIAKPELCTEAATAKVERASFALLSYLEALLLGKLPSAVELFSQYADVQELAGANRIHPADLWAVPWQWRELDAVGAQPLSLDPAFRTRFEKAALMVVKTADLKACAELSQLASGLASQTTVPVEPNFRSFWRIAAGALEAIATGALAADMHVKRTVSRLLIQLSSHAKGDMSVPDRLAQDLLFFCAQATPTGLSPLLGEVRIVYGLAQHQPVDYTKSFYGHFDPTLLVQARKRIGQLKESWSSFTAGELTKAKPVQDQMSLLVDSISKLLPNSGQSLSSALNEVIDNTARQQKAPDAALGMEVATAILYLEATFEDFDLEDKQQATRMAHLAQRVQLARSGSGSQPLESWMEDLYRRVSDRQTMGSVVGELKLTLGELEKLMDAYLRDPQDKVLLSDVPNKLMQMRGVLTVLGLDQASAAAARMRDDVEHIIVADIDADPSKTTATFNRLGNNLGALGFLIDMLSYQPVLAKKLFAYDEAEGELKPLMGRTLRPEPERAPAATATSPVAEVHQRAPEANAKSKLASSLAPLPATPTPAAPIIVDAEDVDPELLEIFLEEAREVAGNGLAATQALVAEPNNIGEMTTLRRAFHTLKGSSRMVGLNVFGEAAWSMEQVMNAWLSDQKPANAQLCELSTQALHAHQAWIEEIASGGGKHRSSAPFRASADALRLHGQFLPIQLEAAAPVVQNIELAGNEPAATIAAAPALSALSTAASSSPEAASLPVPEVIAASTGIDIDNQTLPEIAADLPEVAVPIGSSSDFPSLDMLSLDLSDPGLQPAEPTTAPQEKVPEPDFSSHLSDLDSALAEFDDAVLLAPEPSAIETAPQEAAEPLPAPEAQEVRVDDLDFEFDFEAPTADAKPTSDHITADAGSQVDLSPALTEPALDAAALPDPSLNQEALITAEELAAFERAMMEMDGEPDISQIQDEPLETPVVLNAPQTQPQDVEISAVDLQALQSLSMPLDQPRDEATSSNSTTAGPDSAELPQAAPSWGPTEFVSEVTRPASLGPDTERSALGELGDLGIDLRPSTSAPLSASPSASGAGWLTAGIAATAGAVGVAAVAGKSSPAKPALSVVSTAAPSMGAYAAEEQLKAIGPLRVSLPLYNVYLNEADEWSRLLLNNLSEWAMEPKAKLSSDAMAYAHSLAGSSATVGFSALSGMARALENALNHMQRLEEDGEYDPHTHSALFISAAEDIRRLLHQFAAGILKDGSADIESALLQCMRAPFPVETSAVTADDALNELFLPDDVATLPAVSSLASLEPEPDPALVTQDLEPVQPAPAEPELPEETSRAPLLAESFSMTSAAPLSANLVEAPVLAVRARQLDQDEIDDEIDAVDALDPDLFEIFEEEAQEIFPATAAALRQWTARPENMSARGEVLRGLHTLKGSARLAGAMRLGELAHRMESSVESIPHEGAQASDIEQLMAQLDGMQHTFDVLRNPSLASDTVKASVAPASAQPLVASATQLATAAPMQPGALTGALGMVAPMTVRSTSGQTVRVRSQLLDRLMNQAGEVMITRTRLETELSQLRGSLGDLTTNLNKLRSQLRELDVQAESQMQTRLQQSKDTEEAFDPLEFDRYTRVQELTRMMAESVNDVATVQRNIQRSIESTEDDLVAQARQTRDLQSDLLRTRMVEFEGISERLYRVVRQAGKDTGKQVKLDILGGTIEMDRGVLDRMAPAFEHLLRNCVAHGIEAAEARTAAGKAASGEIVITLHQEGNDVSIEFRDDGAGLNLARIREKAISQGLLGHDAKLAENEAADLIFMPGFSTAAQVTELSGRGVGMDVVRSEVLALGGRIETSSNTGQGTSFKLVLPLTTAVTQVVMMRIGELAIGVPANLIETVRRATPKEVQSAYNSGSYDYAGQALAFFWSGALLQHSSSSVEPPAKSLPVVVFRSAAQRVAVHVDQVLGTQEVVVKNLGPQLSRLPGLAGMTVLASGSVALIYNPVALATVYGAQARAMSFDPAQPHALESQSGQLDVTDAVPRDLSGDAQPVVRLVPANPASISPPAVPLVLVVDDSITVRRVTQRLLQREGYRVTMAADGLQALERLAEEMPSVILSDIEMPRMDGFDLLRNVRADAKLKHLPTIMITSRIAEKHREYAFELGANHYLGKPYNEEELLSLIRRYAREEAVV